MAIQQWLALWHSNLIFCRFLPSSNACFVPSFRMTPERPRSSATSGMKHLEFFRRSYRLLFDRYTLLPCYSLSTGLTCSLRLLPATSFWSTDRYINLCPEPEPEHKPSPYSTLQNSPTGFFNLAVFQYCSSTPNKAHREIHTSSFRPTVSSKNAI